MTAITRNIPGTSMYQFYHSTGMMWLHTRKHATEFPTFEDAEKEMTKIRFHQPHMVTTAFICE